MPYKVDNAGVAPVQLIQDARGKIFSQFLPQCFYFFLGVYCVYFISGLGGQAEGSA